MSDDSSEPVPSRAGWKVKRFPGDERPCSVIDVPVDGVVEGPDGPFEASYKIDVIDWNADPIMMPEWMERALLEAPTNAALRERVEALALKYAQKTKSKHLKPDSEFDKLKVLIWAKVARNLGEVLGGK